MSNNPQLNRYLDDYAFIELTGDTDYTTEDPRNVKGLVDTLLHDEEDWDD